MILAVRHFVVLTAVVMVLAGAGYGQGAPASEGFALSAIQINPKNPNVVYASSLLSDADRRSLVKSTDGGRTWKPADTGLTTPPGLPGIETGSKVRVDALAIDPRSPDVLYAGTGVGVFKTTDGARTWKFASTGIELYAETPGHGFLEGLITALAVDPVQTQTVYAVSLGLWKTTDGGITWKNVFRRGIVDLAIDPRRHTTLYATVERQDPAPRGSMYKSVDGGRSWRTTRPTDLNVNFSEPVAVDRRGILYAGAWKGLFASANQGRTWRTLLPLPHGSGGVSAIALDPSGASVLYVAPAWAGLMKSENGGQTWSDLRPDGRINSIAIAPTNPQTVYAGGDGIWKSTDGGETWQRLPLRPYR